MIAPQGATIAQLSVMTGGTKDQVLDAIKACSDRGEVEVVPMTDEIRATRRSAIVRIRKETATRLS